MAATRLIPLHLNKGKTIAECLKERTDYTENGKKTNDGLYISSYACDCHPSNYKLPLPSECLGLNVGANIVPFTVIGSFPSKTWNLKGARHI